MIRRLIFVSASVLAFSGCSFEGVLGAPFLSGEAPPIVDFVRLGGTTQVDHSVQIAGVLDADEVDDTQWEVKLPLTPSDQGQMRGYTFNIEARRVSDGAIIRRRVTLTLY